MPSRGRIHSTLKIALLGVALCTLFSSSTSAGTASAGVPVCSSAVQKGALPVWARGGFHPPTQPIPHVLGRSGAIVAILFSYPLQASSSVTPANKILWVARVPVNSFTSLRISAQRMKGTRLLGKPVHRTLKGGPGPSFFDLPTPGCWQLSLRWAGRSDGLDLQYRSRR